MKICPIVHLKKSFVFVLSHRHRFNVNKLLYFHEMSLWLVYKWTRFRENVSIFACVKWAFDWIKSCVITSLVYINLFSVWFPNARIPSQIATLKMCFTCIYYDSTWIRANIAVDKMSICTFSKTWFKRKHTFTF